MRLLPGLVAGLLMVGTWAHASGDRIGNGGGVWACVKDGEVLSAVLIDFFEFANEQKLPVGLDIAHADLGEAFAAKKAWLVHNLPSLARELVPYLEYVRKNIKVVERLRDIPDENIFGQSLLRTEPAPETCNGVWERRQFANFTEHGPILVRRDLWESARVPVLTKIGLVYHEAAYSWLRVSRKDKTSYRARLINGLLFSALPPEKIEREIERVLELPRDDLFVPTLHGEIPSRICRMIYVRVSGNWGLNLSRLFWSTAETEREAQGQVLAQCEAIYGPEEAQCLQNPIRCGGEHEEPFPAKTICHLSTPFSIYKGAGKSRFEAETKAMVECYSNAWTGAFCREAISAGALTCVSTPSLLQK